MPIHGYPGNVITANPTAPTVSSASGVWTTEQQLINQSAGNWPMAQTQVSLSTRFNSADSAYLSRTPASTSNQKKWTWSGWVKRGVLSTFGGLMSGYVDANNYTTLYFWNDNTITFYQTIGGSAGGQIATSAVFRDPSAWYHIVIVYDSANATQANRVLIYVNGVQQTLTTTTAITLNTNSLFNVTTATQNLGRHGAGSNYFDGYLAEVNFIDGLALDPSYFGFNDSNTGAWTPKQYTGAYGTNGFFLPFNNNVTSFSADFLVIAGGGGSGPDRGGGGGGGGYRTSAGTSGGGASAESQLALIVGTAYTVTVGAGGTASPNNTTVAGNGNNSVLASVTSTGGGGGGGQVVSGATGGSGGGGGGYTSTSGGSGTANQGYAGGNGYGTETGTYLRQGGGGGGAGGAGVTGTSTVRADGGAGVSSSITGSAVSRGGGGGGGLQINNPATGTAGGGNSGVNGTANTGGGAGGGIDSDVGKAGGSGIVIIKVPNYITASFSGGVTYSLSTSVAGFNIYTVTATSTTSETVTFS